MSSIVFDRNFHFYKDKKFFHTKRKLLIINKNFCNSLKINKLGKVKKLKKLAQKN